MLTRSSGMASYLTVSFQKLLLTSKTFFLIPSKAIMKHRKICFKPKKNPTIFRKIYFHSPQQVALTLTLSPSPRNSLLFSEKRNVNPFFYDIAVWKILRPLPRFVNANHMLKFI